MHGLSEYERQKRGRERRAASSGIELQLLCVLRYAHLIDVQTVGFVHCLHTVEGGECERFEEVLVECEGGEDGSDEGASNAEEASSVVVGEEAVKQRTNRHYGLIERVSFDGGLPLT